MQSRSLLHRWFVQYNPLYLVSAMLVLGGALLCSKGLGETSDPRAPIAIALVTEIYAAALIGGAALLTRMGLRRPAVMLALLVTLYQWDLTLHTETCNFLGANGSWAAWGWLGIFFAKMAGISWALRIRLSWRMRGALALGAFGLVYGQRIVQSLDAVMGGWAVAVWIFSLVALYEKDAITTRFALDEWGDTVLRRATHAVWALSALLISMHVVFWFSEHFFHLGYALLVLPLLPIRLAYRQREAAIIAACTLVLVHFVDHHALWLAVGLVMLSFWMRALEQRRERVRSVLVSGVFPAAVRTLEVTPPPQTTLQWGMTAFVLGFVLLGVALGATWWLRRTAEPDDP